MSNAYVDPWDMLNNFCFHAYAQKWVFVIMSHVACHMSYVKCLCWSLGYAEQILFSCLCSKVSICNYVTCQILHVTCHMLFVKCLCCSLGHAEQQLFSCLCSNVTYMSNVKCQCQILIYVDPWDMLNNIVQSS